MKILRAELQLIIDRIDAGNSNLTEEELNEAIESMRKYTQKDSPLTKYEASNYLHISRATFDNLVSVGKLPQGEKLHQGDSNIFWFKKDLDKYKQNRV